MVLINIPFGRVQFNIYGRLIFVLTLFNDNFKDNRELKVISIKERMDLSIFAVGSTDKRCQKYILSNKTMYVNFFFVTVRFDLLIKSGTQVSSKCTLIFHCAMDKLEFD